MEQIISNLVKSIYVAAQVDSATGRSDSSVILTRMKYSRFKLNLQVNFCVKKTSVLRNRPRYTEPRYSHV